MLMYYTSILPWVVYFFIEKSLFGSISKNLFLPVIFFLLSTAFLSLNQHTLFETFMFLYLTLIHFSVLKGLKTQIKTIIAFWYIGLIIFFAYAEGSVEVEFLIPITLISMLFRKYVNPSDAFLWGILILMNLFVSVFNLNACVFSASLFSFYFMFNKIEEFKQKKEQEKREYKNLLDRALQAEVQNKLNQIDSSFAVASKKLKAIFKMSNYTVSTTDLNAMAERVLEGLISLGYTGIVIYLKPKEILKKEGFFPNFKKLEDDVKTGRWINYKKSYLNSDERFLIFPLKVGAENLGFLAVYKKDGLPANEMEYLSTYANSIAIATANIIHFEEFIKLQEITYKVFEAVDIGIAVINENFEVETLNKAFKQITEYNPKKKNIFEILPEVLYMKKDFTEVLKNLKSFETEFASTRKRRGYRIKVLPLKTENIEGNKLVILIEDITEKEHLENQIIETEKLAVIGKMAAGLSHDIKTPLTIIEGATFRIKKKAKDNKDILELAEKISQQSKRAEKIINRLLNYAKPSYWKLEKINLKEVLKESIEFTKHSIKGKQINITTNLTEDIYIEADKTAIQQVFTNLIINAIEAIKEKGNISITLYRIGSFAEVRIKDDGVGISKENLEKIFDPFFTTKEKGTGLGLAVVERIIKDHSGEIKVISEENKGTTFIVRLPILGGDENG